MKLFTLWSTGTCSNNRGYSGAVLTPTALKTTYRSKMGSLLVLMIFGIAMILPSHVQAQHPYGFFDGNALNDDGKLDWQDVLEGNIPSGSITTGIVFDLAPNDNIFTGGGTKDFLPINGVSDSQSWQWKSQLGSSSDKTNIQEAGAILIDGVIYFFGNRYAAEGATNIGFWLFQEDVRPIGGGRFSGEHTNGDILVVAEIVQGGSSGNVAAYTWDDVTGTLTSSSKTMSNLATDDTTLDAIVNEVSIESPWPHKAKSGPINYMPAITFFEGFINIKKLIDEGKLKLGANCFSTFIIETRASFSLSSILEDFVGGDLNVQPRVTLNGFTACEGDIEESTLEPVVSGGLGTLTFQWYKDQNPIAIADGGTGSTLVVTESGDYSVIVSGNGIGGTPNACSSDKVSATVTINPKPTPTTSNLASCESGADNGTASFDLNNGVTNADGGTITFHTSQAFADAGTPTISSPRVSSGETIYVRSYKASTGCYGTSSFTLTVNDNPDIITAPLSSCETGSTGQATFTLNAGVTDADGGTLSFYTDAALLNMISDADGVLAGVQYTTGTTTIYVKSVSGTCVGTAQFAITVNDNPVIEIDNPQLDCFADSTTIKVTTPFDKTGYSFKLVVKGETGVFSAYPVDGYEGLIPNTTYVLTIKNTSTNCTTDKEFKTNTIKSSPVSPILSAVQPDCATLKGTISVTNVVAGQTYAIKLKSDLGDPVYASYPTNGFDNLAPGVYVVLVKSADGCSGSGAEITLIEPNCVTGEGCTLGYWKNHTNKWCSSYTTCTLYNSIFTESTLDPNLTFLQALNLQGNTDGENLARQSVAALLNACSGSGVGFDLTEAQVIAQTNGAWLAGGSNINTVATALDVLNNAGCPLGGGPSVKDSAACRVSGKPASKVANTVAKGSGNVTLDSNSKTGKFSAFPVPFRETLSIQYDFDYESAAVIQLFDLQGRLLRTYKEANAYKGKVTELSIDFRTRASQVYILKVTTDRDVFTKNVISDK